MPFSPRTAGSRIEDIRSILSHMRPGDVIREVVPISAWDAMYDPGLNVDNAGFIPYRTRTYFDLVDELNQLCQTTQSPEEAMPIRPAIAPTAPASTRWWDVNPFDTFYSDDSAIEQAETPEQEHEEPLMEEPHAEQDHSDPPAIEPDTHVEVVEVSPPQTPNERLAIPQAIYNAMVDVTLIEGVSPYHQEDQIGEEMIQASVCPDSFVAIVHPKTVKFAMDNFRALSSVAGEDYSSFERSISEGQNPDGSIIWRYHYSGSYFMLTPTGRNRALPKLCSLLTGVPPSAMASAIYERFGCFTHDGGWPEAHLQTNRSVGSVERAVYTYARSMLKILSEEYERHAPMVVAAPQERLQVYFL